MHRVGGDGAGANLLGGVFAWFFAKGGGLNRVRVSGRFDPIKYALFSASSFDTNSSGGLDIHEFITGFQVCCCLSRSDAKYGVPCSVHPGMGTGSL